MRPALLLLLAAVAAAACDPAAGPPTERAADADTGRAGEPLTAARAEPGAMVGAHAELSCSVCHSGGQAETGRAAVPRESCTASGCHADAGPAEVRIATVTFNHRRHGAGGTIEPGCAGCHWHDEGEEGLAASVDACALCHVGQLTGADPQECQVCHRQPQHVSLTAEGVPVAHSMLPFTEIGCVRCHYDVAEPPVAVGTDRCAECHQPVDRVVAGGVGRNLHPEHQGLACVACHERGAHRVLAISSAVELICADCHVQAHDMPVAGPSDDLADSAGPDVCLACHEEVHSAQQRLLMGVVAGREPAAPSPKFLAGITCRSCHLPPAQAGAREAGATQTGAREARAREPGATAPGATEPGATAPGATDPIRGQAEACASCHRGEYRQVLDWWLEGVERRLAAAQGYVRAAESTLIPAAPDTTRVLLADALSMLELVAAAGGHHNLELSDRIFRESVELAQAAYRLAGRQPPPAPDLGPRPHMGLCSGCHYGQEPWNYGAMPREFHREVMPE